MDGLLLFIVGLYLLWLAGSGNLAKFVLAIQQAQTTQLTPGGTSATPPAGQTSVPTAPAAGAPVVSVAYDWRPFTGS